MGIRADFFIISVIALFVVSATPNLWAQPTTTPQETVEEFLDLLFAGDMSAYDYWDVDSECDFIFGDFYRSLSDADKEKLREGLISANQPFLSIISELFAEMKIEYLSQRMLTDDIAEVEFLLVTPQEQTHYLYILRYDHRGWRVIRAIVNGMDLDVMLRMTYLTQWQGLSLDEILKKFQVF